jgi:hypothetical protein
MPQAAGDLFLAEAKARQECGVFGVTPSYADDAIRSLKRSDSPYAQIRIAMYQRLKERCQGFSNVTTSDRLETQSLYEKAAKKGNIEAIAHNLVNSAGAMADSVVRIRALAIIHTKNPAAIFELAKLFEEQSSLKLITDLNLNAEESAIALRLVACDLGYDCSYSSSLTQQLCLFGGLCGRGGYRENLQDAGITPHQFDMVVTAENRLLGAIRNGSIDHLIIAQTSGVSTSSVDPFCTTVPMSRTKTMGSHNGVTPFLPLCDDDPPHYGPAATIDASDPAYSDAPALQGVGINSASEVRTAADTQAAGRYRAAHGIFSLKRGQTFVIKYLDNTSETAVVMMPSSSLGSVPIPGSQISSDGTPTGTVTVGEPVRVPSGDGGTATCNVNSSGEWACKIDTQAQ